MEDAVEGKMLVLFSKNIHTQNQIIIKKGTIKQYFNCRVYFAANRTDIGTIPKGSQWTKIPIPGTNSPFNTQVTSNQFLLDILTN